MHQDQLARRLIYGNNWTKIRVGMRCTFDRNGSFTGGIAAGVCNGLRGYGTGGSASCDCALGHWGSTVFNTSYTVSSNAVAIGGTSTVGVTNYNGTIQQTGGAGTTIYLAANAVAGVVWLVDITKGTPNYTIRQWTNQSLANGTTNIPLQTYLGYLCTENNPGTGVLADSGVCSVAYSGGGFLDSVLVVAKMIGDNSFNILDLNVIRFS